MLMPLYCPYRYYYLGGCFNPCPPLKNRGADRSAAQSFKGPLEADNVDGRQMAGGMAAAATLLTPLLCCRYFCYRYYCYYTAQVTSGVIRGDYLHT